MENKDLLPCGSLVLRIAVSKKTNKIFYCLGFDLGYTFKALTFNLNDIAEIVGLLPRELTALSVGDYKIKL